MKNEASFKRELVKEFKRLGHYARRIEDSFSVGFPDLIIIPKGCPVFFCEAKVVEGRTFAPTPRQFVELTRLGISRYCVPCVLGFGDVTMYLHENAKVVAVDECVAKREDENVVEFFLRFYRERAER